MSKYSMTRSRNARAVKTRDLYGSSSINDDGWNHFRYLFGDVGIFGIKPFQIYDNDRYMSDYLSNRGLTWSDMRYPSIAPKSGGINWKVNEKAVKKLYR